MITKVYGELHETYFVLWLTTHPQCYSCQLTYVIVILDLLRRVLQEEKNFGYKEFSVKHDKDYQTVQNHARPDSSYIRETIDNSRSKFPKPLPPRSKRLQSLNESQGTAVNGVKRSHEIETADVLPGITPTKKAKPDPTLNVAVNGSTGMATELRTGNY